ncbi:MAG TPA: TetR family transcriptional regulator [Solirubrobacteraceae bacterium]|nr:TetR family transcriptional regulator [Solirubrobacteraceae bacterium]
MAEVQRVRLLGAMVQEVAEHGAANVSVASVVARSGVSRRTFYELFDDRDACFLAAFDDALRGVSSVVVPAYSAEHGRWQERIRGGLVALLDCLEHDRQTARLLIVESLAAGPRMLTRRQETLAPLIAAVDEGRRGQAGGRAEPPPLTAQGIVGGALSLLHDRLIEGDQASLLELTGALMAMIVAPYLGQAAARKEIAKPTPTPSDNGPVLHASDSLRELPIRLTYRTAMTLSAIADAPGASNRHIGEIAHIADQGQASKLLNRLQRYGLIENTGTGAKGEANAWTLTPTGQDVHNTITNAHT